MGKRFSWLLPNRGVAAGSPQSTDAALAPEILSAWESKVQQWSQDGSLLAAAQEALMLPGEPQALKDLIAQWSTGDFEGIPEIVLLSGTDMNGALGAYAISTGKIYLNADWLKTATQEAIDAVLTEELGHHLDGLLNAVDTPGDEGEYFSDLLRGVVLTDSQKAGLKAERIENNLFSLLKTIRNFQEGKTNVLFISNIETIRGLSLPSTTHLIFYHELPVFELKQVLIHSCQRLGRTQPLQIYHLNSEIPV
jgi:hypothetical protein